jgi:hypothetical protein
MSHPRKINCFTAKLHDVCVRCANPITPGQEVGWLRDANRKGHFHAECAALPTIETLALVRVQDDTAREGYRYVRVRDLKAPALLPEHPVAVRLAAPAPARVPDADGIMVNGQTLATLIAAAIAKMPRIIVNVIVPKLGDEKAALELLSRELFMRSEVHTL